ncbi:MAG: hypothetical protein E7239_13975, partial [Sarcina sp.]|nr:hypothetical protein [Sarcina sp.]
MKSYGVLLRKISRRILSLLLCAVLFCAVLLGGCSAPKPVDTKAGGESTAVPQKVIALSKSNAELWLLAGGSLIGTSEDAMELAGISPETVSLGDMDHVSLEAIAGL